MSLGNYIPLAVRRVAMPYVTGGTRSLGIPTFSDHIVQIVVKDILESLFHYDSYSHCPYKSGYDALRMTGIDDGVLTGCWTWTSRSFFDNIGHELLMSAVRRHTDCRWVQLYIERWITTSE
jgi:retron-type reverse transcriptase